MSSNENIRNILGRDPEGGAPTKQMLVDENGNVVTFESKIDLARQNGEKNAPEAKQ